MNFFNKESVKNVFLTISFSIFSFFILTISASCIVGQDIVSNQDAASSSRKILFTTSSVKISKTYFKNLATKPKNSINSRSKKPAASSSAKTTRKRRSSTSKIPEISKTDQDSLRNEADYDLVPEDLAKDVKVTVLKLPAPPYPKMAAAIKATGSVEVKVTIDEEGNVVEAEAVSGHPLLVKAAVDAARNAKFEPVKVQNYPVRVSGIIVYNFTR